ncbi:hypothetical protein AB656_06165 [Bifidobacterium actinocoloniiforme DSM 22766]|nr:hypothetical protein AB656_06165 [Bifidobacterium actinocoloniiforme DSM 22766]
MRALGTQGEAGESGDERLAGQQQPAEQEARQAPEMVGREQARPQPIEQTRPQCGAQAEPQPMRQPTQSAQQFGQPTQQGAQFAQQPTAQFAGQPTQQFAQEPVEPPAPAAKPRRSPVPWIIGGVAVVVVLALGLILPNLETIGIVLGLGPKNPIAVTLESFRKLPDASSARIKLSVGSGDDFSLEGYYQLGSSTDKSVADFTVKADDYRGRLLLLDNGLYAGGDGQYVYMDGLDVRSELQDVDFTCLPDKTDASTCFDGDSLLELEQNLIRDGHWNTSAAQSEFMRSSERLHAAHRGELKRGKDKTTDTQPQMDTIQRQGQEVLTRFVAKTLEDKDTQGKVFPEQSSHREDSGSRLEYTLDTEQLVRVFSRYMLDSKGDYPELRAYIDDQLGSAGGSYDKLFSAGSRYRDGGEADEKRLPIILRLNRDRTIKSIRCDAKGGMGFELDVSDVNRVKTDDGDLEAFARKAREGQSLKGLGKLLRSLGSNDGWRGRWGGESDSDSGFGSDSDSGSDGDDPGQDDSNAASSDLQRSVYSSMALLRYRGLV